MASIDLNNTISLAQSDWENVSYNMIKCWQKRKNWLNCGSIFTFVHISKILHNVNVADHWVSWWKTESSIYYSLNSVSFNNVIKNSLAMALCSVVCISIVSLYTYLPCNVFPASHPYSPRCRHQSRDGRVRHSNMPHSCSYTFHQNVLEDILNYRIPYIS